MLTLIIVAGAAMLILFLGFLEIRLPLINASKQNPFKTKKADKKQPGTDQTRVKPRVRFTSRDQKEICAN